MDAKYDINRQKKLHCRIRPVFLLMPAASPEERLWRLFDCRDFELLREPFEFRSFPPLSLLSTGS